MLEEGKGRAAADFLLSKRKEKAPYWKKKLSGKKQQALGMACRHSAK